MIVLEERGERQPLDGSTRYFPVNSRGEHSLTTQDLTILAIPYVRHAIKQAKPQITQEIGVAAWIILWPAWSIVTGPLLPILTKLAIELAVGLTAPQLLPILVVLNRIASLIAETYLPEADKALLAEITELLSTARGQMLEPVQETLAIPSAMLVELELK